MRHHSIVNILNRRPSGYLPVTRDPACCYQRSTCSNSHGTQPTAADRLLLRFLVSRSARLADAKEVRKLQTKIQVFNYDALQYYKQ